jgi:hypothetical protein
MGMSNRISIRQRQAKNTLLHIILEVPENYPWFRECRQLSANLAKPREPFCWLKKEPELSTLF